MIKKRKIPSGEPILTLEDTLRAPELSSTAKLISLLVWHNPDNSGILTRKNLQGILGITGQSISKAVRLLIASDPQWLYPIRPKPGRGGGWLWRKKDPTTSAR